MSNYNLAFYSPCQKIRFHTHLTDNICYAFMNARRNMCLLFTTGTLTCPKAEIQGGT